MQSDKTAQLRCFICSGIENSFLFYCAMNFAVYLFDLEREDFRALTEKYSDASSCIPFVVAFVRI